MNPLTLIRTHAHTALFWQLWLKVPEDKLALIKIIVENLHNSSLLIDDIEDGSQTRSSPASNETTQMLLTIFSFTLLYKTSSPILTCSPGVAGPRRTASTATPPPSTAPTTSTSRRGPGTHIPLTRNFECASLLLSRCSLSVCLCLFLSVFRRCRSAQPCSVRRLCPSSWRRCSICTGARGWISTGETTPPAPARRTIRCACARACLRVVVLVPAAQANFGHEVGSALILSSGRVW